MKTQVVIIGGGGSGLAAAVAASQAGADVIVLEKLGLLGGSTNVSEGALNAADPIRQPKLGIEDSVAKHIDQTLKGGHNVGNPELVKHLCEGAYPAVEWLESIGVKFKDEVGTATGALWQRSHYPATPSGNSYIRVFEKYIAEHPNVQVITDIEAKDVLKDADGRVTGVLAKHNKTGRYTLFKAEKGVIIAAGGFGANNELVSKYVPRLKGFATTNHPGAQGEGIVLSEKIGAQLVDMTEIQTHPTVVPKVGEMITEAVRGNGAVLINKDGSRFYNELNTRDAVSAAILKQKDGVAYLFFDSDMQKSLKATNKYITKSYCVSGATIEEVAGKMGVPAAELQASIDAWKKGKAAGKDAFGRADMPRNLDQAPFYAIMVTPAVHHTMGGIKIDSKTQVYNTKGQVVPGLFAAGEITGGVHGGNRLGGNAQADIVTFGRIAGQQSYIYAMQAAAADKAKK